MNKEQILNVVEKLAESGYEFQSDEKKVNFIRERTHNSQILLTFKDSLLDLCVIRIRRKLNYSQEECEFLNNIAYSLFYYHEHWIDFEYKPKDEKELEETFKFLLENYN